MGRPHEPSVKPCQEQIQDVGRRPVDYWQGFINAADAPP